MLAKRLSYKPSNVIIISSVLYKWFSGTKFALKDSMCEFETRRSLVDLNNHVSNVGILHLFFTCNIPTIDTSNKRFFTVYWTVMKTALYEYPYYFIFVHSNLERLIFETKTFKIKWMLFLVFYGIITCLIALFPRHHRSVFSAAICPRRVCLPVPNLSTDISVLLT